MALNMARKVNVCKIIYSNNDRSDSIPANTAYLSLLKI